MKNVKKNLTQKQLDEQSQQLAYEVYQPSNRKIMQAPKRDFLSLNEFKNWMQPYKEKLEIMLYNVLRNGSKQDYHELKIFIDERNWDQLYNEPTRIDHQQAIKVWNMVTLIGGKIGTLAGCNIAIKCDPFYFNVMRNIDSSALIIANNKQLIENELIEVKRENLLKIGEIAPLTASMYDFIFCLMDDYPVVQNQLLIFKQKNPFIVMDRLIQIPEDDYND